jgi:hypothetical protein
MNADVVHRARLRPTIAAAPLAAGGGLPLGEVRQALATALAPVPPATEPNVLIDYPDMVTPPALVVVWDDPWLEQPRTMGPCVTLANIVVLCVGSRVEAGPGIDTIEQLVTYTIDRLQADTVNKWPLGSAQAPREWIISNVHYLGARLAYRVPVSV